MSTELLAGLAAFAFVTSITPGPNELMPMTSGANFGIRRSVPPMLGVSLGFVFTTALVGTGLAESFERHPAAHTALKVASVSYLLYLAWRIATAAPSSDRGATAALGANGSDVPISASAAAGRTDGRVAERFGSAAEDRPLDLWQAAAFRWLDPKACAMALTAVTVYTESRAFGEIPLVAALFGLLNLPSVGVWTVLGCSMRRMPDSPRRRRRFNLLVALPLLGSRHPALG